MADKRIKDIPTEATSFAGDDYLVIDGTTNAQRKILASRVPFTAANGLVTRTAANTWAARTLTGTAGQITVVNGDGVSGNPTISLPSTITQATTFSAGQFTVGNNTAATTSSIFAGTDTNARLEMTETGNANGGWIAYEGANNRLRIGTSLSGSDTAAISIARASADVSFLGTTASTSTTTGSLINAGGFGNAGKAFFGDTINATLSSEAEFNGITVTNPNGGTTTESSIYVGNGGTGATSTAIGGTGTSYTAVGGFLQNAGYLSSGTSMSGGLSIMSRAATSAVRIYAGSHTNLVATFGSTGQVSIASTTESTTGGAGSLTTGGGIYAAKKIIAGTSISPSASAVTWTAGSGTPEGAVTAPVGSIFSRTDGGASTSFYVKESGAGNTGWVAK